MNDYEEDYAVSNGEENEEESNLFIDIIRSNYMQRHGLQRLLFILIFGGLYIALAILKGILNIAAKMSGDSPTNRLYR